LMMAIWRSRMIAAYHDHCAPRDASEAGVAQTAATPCSVQCDAAQMLRVDSGPCACYIGHRSVSRCLSARSRRFPRRRILSTRQADSRCSGPETFHILSLNVPGEHVFDEQYTERECSFETVKKTAESGRVAGSRVAHGGRPLGSSAGVRELPSRVRIPVGCRATGPAGCPFRSRFRCDRWQQGGRSDRTRDLQFERTTASRREGSS